MTIIGGANYAGFRSEGHICDVRACVCIYVCLTIMITVTWWYQWGHRSDYIGYIDVVLQYKLLLQNCLIWDSNGNGCGGEKFRKRCQY